MTIQELNVINAAKAYYRNLNKRGSWAHIKRLQTAIVALLEAEKREVK